MDDDVVAAIITQLRTVSAITALVGTRIYHAAQVPHDSPFPRGMVGSDQFGDDQWSEQGQYCTRFPIFTVEWVTRNVESQTPTRDVQTLDLAAITALRGTLAVANLVLFQRRSVLKAMPQTNDNIEYISGGGIWVARREYDYRTG